MRGWRSSATIRHLGFALLYWGLTWVSVSIATDAWDWKYLAAGALSILIPAVQRLAGPDLIAPLDVLNRRNPQ